MLAFVFLRNETLPMNQPQRQFISPTAEARSAGVRAAVAPELVTGALGVLGGLIISGLISVLGIVEISRTAGAAT